MGSASKAAYRECANCGDEVKVYGDRRYIEHVHCSQECAHDRVHVDRECKYCGSLFEVHQRELERGDRRGGRYCSKECMDKWRSENWVGESNPLYVDSQVECEYCGNQFQKRPAKIELHDKHFCSRDCHGRWISENNVGKNHPRWKGGHAEYGERWYAARRKALKRDNKTCQDCGQHKDELDRRLHVHHITPVRDFADLEKAHDLDNLITLCISCHAKWEGLYLRPDIR